MNKNTALCLGMIAVVLSILVFQSSSRDTLAAVWTRDACNPTDRECVVHRLSTIAHNEGLATALDTIRASYTSEPTFRPSCHDITMRMGAGMASTAPSYIPSDPQLSLCNYGFLHGYPAARMRVAQSVDEVAAMCARIGDDLNDTVPDAGMECFRGFGRGLPFVHTYVHGDPEAMVKFAIRECDDHAPTREDVYSCYSGVFSSIGLAMSQGWYKLATDVENPFWLCDQQSGEVRSRCIGNIKWAEFPLLDETDPVAVYDLLHARNASEEEVDSVIWTAAYEMARTSLDKYSNSLVRSAAENCLRLPDVAARQCIGGFALGLAKNGFPESRHMQVLHFCSQVPASHVDVCTQTSLLYISGLYEHDRFRNICTKFKQQLGVVCPEF